MNVSSTTIPTVKNNNGTSSSTASNSSSSTSFKDELESVKTQEEATVKTEETSQVEDAQITAKKETEDNIQAENEIKTQEALKAEEAAKNNLTQTADEKAKLAAEKNLTKHLAQHVEKDKIDKSKLDKKTALKNADNSDPIEELSSKIAKLSEIKNSSHIVQGTTLKTDEKSDCFKSMKMDNNDITFFANLVQTQTTATQGVSINNLSAITADNIKTEATQQTTQVSSTLMDALNTSMTTNKPFRIDFDQDIAVIMKVDKDGVLSAKFIPGSGAVEAYLKQNLPLLRQSFDDQKLPYNELSYNNQQKQKQKQENDKENKNE